MEHVKADLKEFGDLFEQIFIKDEYVVEFPLDLVSPGTTRGACYTLNKYGGTEKFSDDADFVLVPCCIEDDEEIYEDVCNIIKTTVDDCDLRVELQDHDLTRQVAVLKKIMNRQSKSMLNLTHVLIYSPSAASTQLTVYGAKVILTPCLKPNQVVGIANNRGGFVCPKHKNKNGLAILNTKCLIVGEV